MEKSFVAYEKRMFLHIGARYIDQRAIGDVNDQNYMEILCVSLGDSKIYRTYAALTAGEVFLTSPMV